MNKNEFRKEMEKRKKKHLKKKTESKFNVHVRPVLGEQKKAMDMIKIKTTPFLHTAPREPLANANKPRAHSWR